MSAEPDGLCCGGNGASVYIRIEPDSPVPVYQQLHDRIIEAIAAGDLADGAELESVRSLAKNFGINPATVKKAYDLLHSEGLIVTRSRSGSVVSLPTVPPQEGLGCVRAELTTVVAKGLCMGMAPDDVRSVVDSALEQLRSVRGA